MKKMAFNNMFYPQNYQNLDALYNQISQLRNNIQSPIQNAQQPNGVVQVGTYVVVKTMQDMENYPVPCDGNPVNIFVEGSGIFYSKKMINGVVSGQPFSFAPFNNTTPQQEPVEEVNDKDKTPAWAELMFERMNNLEKRLDGKKPVGKKGDNDGV